MLRNLNDVYNIVAVR